MKRFTPLFLTIFLISILTAKAQWQSINQLTDLNAWSYQPGFIGYYNGGANAPGDGVYGNGIQMVLPTDTRFGAQIIIPTFENQIYYRRNLAGTWDAWMRIWSSSNLNRNDVDFTARNMYANGNVGIGTVSPNGKLDVNGAILLSGSTDNTMSRPAVGSARIAGEIGSYSANGLAYDDGFLRISAGGGTNALKSFIDLSGYSTVPDMDRNIILGTLGAERMRINSAGDVGIGTTATDSKLTVNGTIHAKEVKVDMNVLPDYVFQPLYDLPSLKAIKAFVDHYHHLPDVPSAQQAAKEGLNLGEMNALLLKKVEELTLYLIEKDAQVARQNQQLADQQKVNQSLQEQINQLAGQINSSH